MRKIYAFDWLFQDLAECDHEKNGLMDQLSEMQKQNEKMEGLIHFLEQEKKRLQDKVERMTLTGELVVILFILFGVDV